MKVLIVNDQALAREGLRHALQSLGPDVNVLEARDAEQALRQVELHRELDLVLLDLELPGANGFTMLAQLNKRNAALPVVILSAWDDRSHVITALNLGAAGFIPKSSSRDVTLQAVRLVLAGSKYIPPQALGLPDGRALAPHCDMPARHGVSNEAACLRLTGRQMQVFRLLACGKPNKIIARELAISEATVKAHVGEIMRTLRVSNRVQAIIAGRSLVNGAQAMLQ